MLPDFLFETDFWIYVLVGFCAQMVDGALGMAYGTLSTSVLLASGLPPLVASASVHTAQFFTTGLSALSHSYFKNTNKRLVILLGASGAVGGIAGAMLLTVIDGKVLKPWISAYLVMLGFFILWRIIRGKKPQKKLNEKKRYQIPLGTAGGFLDALGGGGWGPIVTTTLMAKGEEARAVIGSVNTAEFFVKTVIAVTFITTIGFTFHEVVIGLLVGGMIAAPLGAYVLRFIKTEFLMAGVGAIIILLSGSILVQTLFF